MEETGKNPIQVAERLFQVIECLAENGPMGIMDLSAQLGFHKSTTHRLVTSLQYMGYIRQDEESLKYALSLKFLEIGGKILEQTNMASLVHPSLKKLSEQTGETVHLVRREGTEAVYIDKVESNVSSIRMVSRVGSRIPLYCSGVGKALLGLSCRVAVAHHAGNSRERYPQQGGKDPYPDRAIVPLVCGVVGYINHDRPSIFKNGEGSSTYFDTRRSMVPSASISW